MNSTTKKCPMCAEEIPLSAVICEYCGAQFVVTGSGYCQNCHDVSKADANGRCQVCGNKLSDLRLESKYTGDSVETHSQPPPIPTAQQPQTPTKEPRQSTHFHGLLIACVLISIVALVGGGLMIVQNHALFLESPSITPKPTSITLHVPATEIWYNTTIQIHKGQVITFTASGTVSTWVGSPIGDIPGPNGGDTCEPLDNSQCLLKSAPYGSLIGKIGKGTPFLIGSNLGMKASEDGSLYLAINDNLIYYEDNSGAYSVTITIK